MNLWFIFDPVTVGSSNSLNSVSDSCFQFILLDFDTWHYALQGWGNYILATGLFYIPLESSWKMQCNLVLFVFFIFWHSVSKKKWKLKGKIGFLKASVSLPFYPATYSNIKKTQILSFSRCMQNFCSLLYLFWHLQRGLFRAFLGKVDFCI